MPVERDKPYPGSGGLTVPRFLQWDGRPPRNPRRGEFFLSGATIAAHLARSDMTTPYCIAESDHRERCCQCGAVKGGR